MRHSVFISYARAAHARQALALYEALGGKEGLAFLDEPVLQLERRFSRELAAALLSSRVVVIFPSEAYFQSRFCLWELEMALDPYRRLKIETPAVQRSAALAHVVLARPSHGTVELHHLPMELRGTLWPTAEEIPELKGLVDARLASCQRTLREQLLELGVSEAALDDSLLEERSLRPTPLTSTGPMYPLDLDGSLGDSFVGRTNELWSIHDALSVAQDRRASGTAGAPLTLVLHGAAGFGKTRLALEYFHRYGPRYYPGGLFWIQANGKPLDEQFHGILRTLQPDVPDLARLQESGKTAAGELAQALAKITASQRVLYVVDNLPEPQPGEEPPSLETWCPVKGRVSLLVTSRAEVGQGRLPHLPLVQLGAVAAQALLTEGLGATGLASQEWLQIADWVGRHALALTLLNGYLRSPTSNPRDVLALASKQRPTHDLKLDPLQAVRRAFRQSYKHLSRRERLAARLVAQLAPAPIPLELLRRLGPDVFESVGKLRSHGFVMRVWTSADGTRFVSGMHQLLAECLQREATWPLAELRAVCRGLVAVLDSSPVDTVTSWEALEGYRPHAESVFRRLMEANATSSLERICAGLGFSLTDHEEIDLGFSLAHLSSAKGMNHDTLQIEQRLVDHAAHALGPEHLDTLIAMDNMAQTLRDLGRLEEARALQERVLQIRSRRQGADHADTLRTHLQLLVTRFDMGHLRVMEQAVLVWQSLAQVLGGNDKHTLLAESLVARMRFALGAWHEARQLQEEILKARLQGLGEKAQETLEAMSELASTLQERDLNGAQRLERQVLKTMSGLRGREHPDTLIAMHNLAVTLLMKKKVGRARALLCHALLACHQKLGTQHPLTITMMSSMAELLREQERFDWAKQLQEQVLEVRRQQLGPEHPDTLTAMGRLALTLRRQRDLEAARKLQEEELAIRVRVFEPEDRRMLMAISNLAETLQEQGNVTEALEQATKSVNKLRKALGEDHPDFLAALNRLAKILRTQEYLADARALQEEVLAKRRQELGEEHPDTVQAKAILARTQYEMGEMEEATRLQKQVLESRSRLLGEEHLLTLEAMLDLYDTLRESGDILTSSLPERIPKVGLKVLGDDHPLMARILSIRLASMDLHVFDKELMETRSLQERLLEVQHRQHGAHHPWTVGTMVQLAITLREQGKLNEAEKLGRLALSAGSQVLGREDEQLYKAMASLALTLYRQGNLEEAKELGERAVEGLLRVMGENSYVTLDVMGHLAETLYRMGQLEDARLLLERILALTLPYQGGLLNAVEALDMLANVHEAMGEAEKAEMLRVQRRELSRGSSMHRVAKL